ncbi:MAG TPA: lipid A deacylase LpxR family protein [Alphaproteobacteria bacterium]|nr:lipid A deacylase LpxR family protein [Alphaproteobacteria bacterium]
MFFLFLALFASFQVLAGDADESRFSRLAEDSALRSDAHSFLSFAHENDLLAGSGDKFYTSGAQITYFNVRSKPPVFIKKIVDEWGGFDIGDATLTSFTLGQKIFTPQDIEIAAVQPNDRPWAGWLYGSVSMANVRRNHVDQLGLTLGVIGPASMAEQTQKFVHEHISNSPEPKGWNGQLHAEPGLVVQWGRRWPLWREVRTGGYGLQFEPNVSVAAGNVYTYGGSGMVMTFGPDHGGIQDTPPRLFPSLPGTGYFDTSDRVWDWYLFAGVNGRVVARNLFLDGNTFRDSPSVDKKPLVADANAGLALTLGTTRIAYTLVYRTREFDGQDEPSVFGSVSLTQRF